MTSVEDLSELDFSVVLPTNCGLLFASSFVLPATRNAVLLFASHLTKYPSDVVLIQSESKWSWPLPSSSSLSLCNRLLVLLLLFLLIFLAFLLLSPPFSRLLEHLRKIALSVCFYPDFASFMPSRAFVRSSSLQLSSNFLQDFFATSMQSHLGLLPFAASILIIHPKQQCLTLLIAVSLLIHACSLKAQHPAFAYLELLLYDMPGKPGQHWSPQHLGVAKTWRRLDKCKEWRMSVPQLQLPP